MDELRKQAEKVTDLYVNMKEAFPYAPHRELMILAVMAGIKDAEGFVALRKEKP